jgi:pyruvate formate lyase activating enzyme
MEAIHADSRAEFGLPMRPLCHRHGIRCTLYSNECVIGEDERGFCGLRTVRNGRLVHLAGTPARGLLHWCGDPLTTICVTDWVCGGKKHPDCHNLAVFYESCTANCLFCQNWHFREALSLESGAISACELSAVANSHTFCICFFGGDPASQMPHAIATSKLLVQRGVRICWETNGMMHPKLLGVAVEYSICTGGCVKFDLKAFDEGLHLALTGVSNQHVLDNFARAARRCDERPDPPLVIASTLLVPGYVDVDHVSKITVFIAAISPRIPYTLLTFAPNFHMSDLPYTSTRHAGEAEAAAREAGLVNVRWGTGICWGRVGSPPIYARTE